MLTWFLIQTKLLLTVKGLELIQIHKTDLLVVEFSLQSESGLPAGGEQGQGEAEVMVNRMAQDHTAGPPGRSDTAARTLQQHRHLAGKRKIETWLLVYTLTWKDLLTAVSINKQVQWIQIKCQTWRQARKHNLKCKKKKSCSLRFIKFHMNTQESYGKWIYVVFF